MRVIENLRYALRVMGRLLNVFVVMPAACATLAMMFGFGLSFHDLAFGIFSYFKELPASTSAEVWSSEAAATASTIYWMFVLIGIASNIMVMGPRDFFMMHPTQPDSHSVSGGQGKV